MKRKYYGIKSQIVDCICHQGRYERKNCIEKRCEAEMEKFRIENIEFLFLYGLWLKKEVEKFQTRRGQLVEIGGQVIKCVVIFAMI